MSFKTSQFDKLALECLFVTKQRYIIINISITCAPLYLEVLTSSRALYEYACREWSLVMTKTINIVFCSGNDCHLIRLSNEFRSQYALKQIHRYSAICKLSRRILISGVLLVILGGTRNLKWVSYSLVHDPTFAAMECYIEVVYWPTPVIAMLVSNWGSFSCFANIVVIKFTWKAV